MHPAEVLEFYRVYHVDCSADAPTVLQDLVAHKLEAQFIRLCDKAPHMLRMWPFGPKSAWGLMTGQFKLDAANDYLGHSLKGSMQDVHALFAHDLCAA